MDPNIANIHCSFPVASSVENTVPSLSRARSESVSPARSNRRRLAQTGSAARPRRPWICWVRRYRTSVSISLPSLTRWNASTETAVRGSHIRRALQNAAEGSIATTCTPSRHWRGRAKSHRPVAVFIDAKHPRCQSINIGQGQRGTVECPLDQPPRDAVRGCCFRSGPSGCDDCGGDGVAEPAGGPCPVGHFPR